MTAMTSMSIVMTYIVGDDRHDDATNVDDESHETAINRW
jgi:hypothetical protein